ncbi:MAG: ABC transporter ATP-binding protein [Candidatus Omnitrophica bacterium]|nr:ABC transporter ATP-binding protein [Candidatus Omnitrophota bacterium]
MSEPVIEIRNVQKWFGERRVLTGVNVDVHEGETLVIMGGSGCGKSTLLRAIIGLMHPEEGSIKIFGQDMASATDDEKNEIRKKFGMLFQGSALFNSLTVGENVALPLKEHTDLDDDIINIIVKVKLELVGLTGFESLKPFEISGGMKKRVALARAIALDPKIVFYDEPGAGLDPITASVIDHLIMDLSKKLKMTSVVVTHEMTSAFRIADRIIVLQQGKVVAEGGPEAIRKSDHPYVKQFIHGEIDGPISFKESRDSYLKGIFGDEEI